MADTLVSDAVAFPQDEGLAGISNDQERWSSAGYLAALAQFIGSGGYVHSGLTFSGHDAANDQVDLDAGRCFVVAATGTMGVDVQSTLGGLSSPAYDTTLQAAIPLLIELPTTVTNLAVQDSTTSAVWVAYDNDGTGPGSAGTVYVRTDDTGSVTAPSHPSVKIGEANPDDSTADTRANDNPTETFQKVTTDALGIIEGSHKVNYDLIDVVEDTGDGAVFSHDTGALSTVYDTYHVSIMAQNEAAAAAANEIRIQLNGDTGTNYYYRSVSGTSFATTTSASQIALVDMTGDTNGWFIGQVGGMANKPSGVPNDRTPVFGWGFGGAYNSEVLHTGSWRNEGRVDQLKIFTENNATARLVLIGEQWTV